MFRWRTTAAAAMTTAALLLTACSGGQAEEAGASELTLINIASPSSYNPAEGASWGNGSIYMQAVFDALLSQDDSGELQPWLATDWSYDDSNTVLTLTLRDDVFFTDGEQLTAEAAVLSLEHFRDGTASNSSRLSAAEFEAVDDTTLVITLDDPDPAFLNYLAQDAGTIASPSMWENENAATEPVGSGPYVLDTDRTVTGTTYVYTRNEDYWNADAVHYDALTINVLGDTTSIVNAIKAGEANGARLPNNSGNAEIEASGWTIHPNEINFQGILLLDRDGTLNPALNDVRVRQAINYAFDREALLDALQDGLGTPTSQPFGPTSEAYDAELDDSYPYDPEKAQELLAEAGYADGLTISMPSTATYQSTFDLVSQQLADIGITVEYTDSGDVGDFISDILTPKYEASWMVLQQDPDWQLVEFLVSPTATWNPFGTEDETVAALSETMQYGSEDEAAEAAGALNRYLIDEAWFAPLYRVQSSFATDADTEVTSWATNVYPSLFSFEPKD